jgi:hypothetical protein
VGKNRDLNPLDPLPADQIDALNEFIGTLVSPNFELRIRAADATVLEIPAGPGMDQVTAGVGDPADATKARWRWITATVSRAGLAGAARTQDVWITANESSFAPGTPGEVDNTDYSFALAITEAGGLAPAGALKRKVGSATWDGAKFTAVDPLVGRRPTLKLSDLHRIGTAAARPAASAALEGLEYTVTSTGNVFKVVNGAWAYVGGILLLTPAQFLALPAQPDGSVVRVLVDATAGVAWRLRFNAGSANAAKWEFDGGRPLVAEINPAHTRASNVASVYGDATTPGPQVVAPLAGDYDVSMFASSHIPAGSTAGSSTTTAVQFGAAAVDGVNDTMFFSAYTGGTTTQAASIGREPLRRTIAAAGTTVKMVYSASDTLTYQWSRRTLSIVPDRVQGP